MLLEQDENNFYMRTDHTANRRIRYYNMLLEFYSKYCRFNIFVIVLLLLIIILSSINLHYMSLMNQMASNYIPKFKEEIDEILVRFNEDSDQIQNVSDIINSEEFQNTYHKVNEFVTTISIDDLNKIDLLLNSIDPKEVGELIHKLCQLYDC